MSQPIIRDLVPGAELLGRGHTACPGCGGALAMKLVLKALGPDVALVMPECCLARLAGSGPADRIPVPVIHAGRGEALAAAATLRADLERRGEDSSRVVCWADRAGAFEAGFDELAAAAARNEEILYICYDTEVPTGTGLDPAAAPSTRTGVAPTPDGRLESRLREDLPARLAAAGVSAVATACVAWPDDLVRKVQRLRDRSGTRVLQVLSPCPPGWDIETREMIELGRRAVHSRLFPLLEFDEAGWRFSIEHRGDPVADVLKRQGRYRHLDDAQITTLQAEVDARWRALEARMAGAVPGPGPGGSGE